MNREQAKDIIKGRLEDYLTGQGINTRKNFKCLNPEHSDNNPSMSFDRNRNKAHCFACGADYDTLDLIGIEYGLTDNKDIFQKAYEVFGLMPEGSRPSAAQDFGGQGQKQMKSGQYTDYTHNTDNTNNKPAVDYMPYFKECQAKVGQTGYFKERGLSDETMTRFVLGYDEAFSKGTGGASWGAVIIPTGKGSYTARNTDPTATKENRIRKQGGSPLYNIKTALKTDKPAFVVEGEIDALSVIEAGGNALALGSTANYNHLINYFKQTGTKPAHPLLIALDNDQDGEATAQKLLEGLQELDITAYKVNVAVGYKDPNEALTADRNAFTEAVQNAEHIGDAAKEAEKEEYLQTNTANHLQAFINGIAASVDTPYIPTGFEQLDSFLDGGLFEGLYIFGAISSLGKTTFLCQVADQIAQSGRDVLIFSLEMARSEIMAKSISRHTLTDCLENSIEVANAKTTRGITTGTRYMNYSQKEKDLIQRSIEAYGEYAGHIYINEGIGDIGAAQIRETIQRHISFTGNTPVVIVDYLQILAPYNERATDKQNTDKAVMELKRISRDYKLPVVGISSFNRQNYKEAVTMEAFKESGAIEYSSDVLIGLQLKGAGEKNFDANAQKDKNPRAVELVILKNRNGPTGKKVPYDYYPLFNYFKEEA